MENVETFTAGNTQNPEDIYRLIAPPGFPPMDWVNAYELVEKLEGQITSSGETENGKYKVALRPKFSVKIFRCLGYEGELYLPGVEKPIHPAQICKLCKPEWTKEQTLQWLNEHFPKPDDTPHPHEGDPPDDLPHSEMAEATYEEELPPRNHHQEPSPVDQSTGDKKLAAPKRTIRKVESISQLPVCRGGFTGIPMPILEIMVKKALTDTERLYLAICRKTLGWSQDGMYFTLRPLRDLTGMGTSATSRALKNLKDRGWVVAKRGEGIFPQLPPELMSNAPTDNRSSPEK